MKRDIFLTKHAAFSQKRKKIIQAAIPHTVSTWEILSTTYKTRRAKARKMARIFGDSIVRYKICLDVEISAACEALKRRKGYCGTENKDTETSVKSNGVTGAVNYFLHKDL